MKQRKREHMHGVFDIVGPVMIGPSSSHTAGAVRLGLMARKVLGEPHLSRIPISEPPGP